MTTVTCVDLGDKPAGYAMAPATTPKPASRGDLLEVCDRLAGELTREDAQGLVPFIVELLTTGAREITTPLLKRLAAGLPATQLRALASTLAHLHVAHGQGRRGEQAVDQALAFAAEGSTHA